jgi:hypothetical protein
LNDGNYDDGIVRQDDYVYCEVCNNKPCDWTGYWPGIIVDEEKMFVLL